jgi:alkanesulfonate monooxygenase SsuD/methylene tetrahydromethanopterin reductase-like flavin-dependent oxidoreductase (luciferase family)
MHVGLYLAPQTGGDSEDIANIEAVIEQAIEADEAGFSTIYLTEHHLDDYNTFSDSMMLGSHLAGQVRSAWLATAVSLVTLHHPLRVVEQFNLLDVLCKGRVLFGLAGGGGPFMYEGLGRDAAQRNRALEETIDAMLRIWAHKPGESLEIETVYDRARITGRVQPTSYRKPHPYLARGTNTESTIREYAKRGWPVMVGRFAPERMGELTRFYRSALDEAGHSPELVRWCMQWMASTKIVYVGESDERAQAEADGPMRRYFDAVGRAYNPKDRLGRFAAPDGGDTAKEARYFESGSSFEDFMRAFWLIGSPDTVLKELQAYAAEGVPQMRIWFTFGPGCTHENFRKSFRLFVDEVLPGLNPEPISDLKPSALPVS